MTTQRLYTPAEIFRAAAECCDLNSLLPEGRTCNDCMQKKACQFILGESFDPTWQHCDWSPSRFINCWRPRRTSADTAENDGEYLTGENDDAGPGPRRAA